MATPAETLADFAQRMGMTSSAAEDLLRRLGQLSSAADNSTSAMDASREATNRMTASQRQTTESLQTLGRTTKDVATQMLTLPGQISGANGQIFSAVTPALTAVSNLAQSLPSLLGTASGLIAKITPGLGPVGKLIATTIGSSIGKLSAAGLQALTTVTSFMLNGAEEVIKSYMSMSQVGATFGGSITNLSKLISETGFSLQTLTKAATANANNLALIGGTVEGGLKKVVNVSRNLSPELVTVYGGFENLNNEITEYLTLRRLQGIDEHKRSRDLTKDTSEYLYNLKMLSTITGKTSKQLNDEISQRTRSAAAQQMLLDMTPEQKENFENQLRMIQDDATRIAYQDFVMSKHYGMAMSRTTTHLTSMMPQLEKQFEKMNSAINMQSDASMKITADSYKETSEASKAYRKQYGFLLQGVESGRLQSQVLQDMNNFLTNIGQAGTYASSLPESLKLASESIKLLKSGVDQVKVLTGTVDGILRSQQALQTEINKIFMGQGLFNGKMVEGGRLAFIGGINEFITTLFTKIVEGINDGTISILDFLRPRTDVEQAAAGGGSSMMGSEGRLRGAILTETMALEQFERELAIARSKLRTEQGRMIGPDTSKVRELELQINELETYILESREQIQRLQRSQADQEQSQNSSNTSGSSSSNNAQSSVQPTISNSSLDESQAYARFERAIREQNTVLTNLAQSVISQGEQIYRAVNRMA